VTAYTNGWYRPDRALFETLAECPEVAEGVEEVGADGFCATIVPVG